MTDIIAIIGAFMCGWLSRDAPGTFLKRTVLIVSYAMIYGVVLYIVKSV